MTSCVGVESLMNEVIGEILQLLSLEFYIQPTMYKGFVYTDSNSQFVKKVYSI